MIETSAVLAGLHLWVTYRQGFQALPFSRDLSQVHKACHGSYQRVLLITVQHWEILRIQYHLSRLQNQSIFLYQGRFYSRSFARFSERLLPHSVSEFPENADLRTVAPLLLPVV